MHESHVAADLVAEAIRIAEAEEAPIRQVRLRIGANSHIQPEALRMHFTACAAGSASDRATVVIEPTREPDTDGVRLVSVTVGSH